MVKTFKYTSKLSQSQKVVGVTLNLKEGTITERELKNLKKDAYGASLLEKGLLIIGAEVTAEPTPPAPAEGTGETIPNFDSENGGKSSSPDQEHAGWKPED